VRLIRAFGAPAGHGPAEVHNAPLPAPQAAPGRKQRPGERRDLLGERIETDLFGEETESGRRRRRTG
jgi:hypothetical protein